MWQSILSILDWAKGKIPIQSRIERWKNELDNLSAERSELIKGAWNEKRAARLLLVDKRRDYLVQLLKNSANAY